MANATLQKSVRVNAGGSTRRRSVSESIRRRSYYFILKELQKQKVLKWFVLYLQANQQLSQ